MSEHKWYIIQHHGVTPGDGGCPVVFHDEPQAYAWRQRPARPARHLRAGAALAAGWAWLLRGLCEAARLVRAGRVAPRSMRQGAGRAV